MVRAPLLVRESRNLRRASDSDMAEAVAASVARMIKVGIDGRMRLVAIGGKSAQKRGEGRAPSGGSENGGGGDGGKNQNEGEWAWRKIGDPKIV